MAHAITQSCCSDASCVTVCPVDCIHPRPDEPDFATAEMLYIDPRSCIDCGACADACPVDAIKPADLLTGSEEVWVRLNAEAFAAVPEGGPDWDAPVFPAALEPAASGLRVAVVGTGPSAAYTAAGLLTTSAEVTMVDRLPVAGGLVRFGVAPDHTSTQGIAARFATVLANPRLRTHLGVEVGTHVSHEELLAHHDAVVYATGASADRRLDVAGEDLPGSLPARTVVGWYNDHPEVPADLLDLAAARAGRAVVVGTGNVALDVVRVLLSEPDRLDGTRIAQHALDALRRSRLHEVVVLARRGPVEASWSPGELREVLGLPGLDVVLDASPEHLAAIAAAEPGSRAAALQGLPVVSGLSPDAGVPGRRRLVLRFGAVVDHVEGADRVEAVHVAPTGRAPGGDGAPPERVPADLLVRSIGYRAEPLPGLPFDHESHVVPHRAGRVEGAPATYVVGWAKRGPRGGIGSNRADAAETVASIVADANAGLIGGARRAPRRDFARLVRRRTAPAPVGGLAQRAPLVQRAQRVQSLRSRT